MRPDKHDKERSAVLFNRILEAIAKEPVDVVRQVDYDLDGSYRNVFGHYEVWRIHFRHSGFSMMLHYHEDMEKTLESIARDCVKKMRAYQSEHENRALNAAYICSGTSAPPPKKKTPEEKILEAAKLINPETAARALTAIKDSTKDEGKLFQKELQEELDEWLESA